MHTGARAATSARHLSRSCVSPTFSRATPRGRPPVCDNGTASFNRHDGLHALSRSSRPSAAAPSVNLSTARPPLVLRGALQLPASRSLRALALHRHVLRAVPPIASTTFTVSAIPLVTCSGRCPPAVVGQPARLHAECIPLGHRWTWGPPVLHAPGLPHAVRLHAHQCAAREPRHSSAKMTTQAPGWPCYICCRADDWHARVDRSCFRAVSRRYQWNVPPFSSCSASPSHGARVCGPARTTPPASGLRRGLLAAFPARRSRGGQAGAARSASDHNRRLGPFLPLSVRHSCDPAARSLRRRRTHSLRRACSNDPFEVQVVSIMTPARCA